MEITAVDDKKVFAEINRASASIAALHLALTNERKKIKENTLKLGRARVNKTTGETGSLSQKLVFELKAHPLKIYNLDTLVAATKHANRKSLYLTLRSLKDAGIVQQVGRGLFAAGTIPLATN